MNQIQAYFKSDKLPRWFKFLNLSILLPILLWPLIFFTTIFFFDNPSNLIMIFILFIIVNAYPIYLIILVLINAKLYTWNKWLGLILPFVIILSLGFGTIYVCYNMIKNIAKAEKVELERVNRGDLDIDRLSVVFSNYP
jgi:hypothetical protein